VTTVTIFKKYVMIQRGHKKIWIKKDDPLLLFALPLIIKKEIEYVKILEEIGTQCKQMDKECIINYLLSLANTNLHSLSSFLTIPPSMKKSKSKSLAFPKKFKMSS